MTRMWMVNPKIMCKNHLLGEHKEIHQLLGSIRNNISINGYVEKRIIEPRSIFSRHQRIMVEMAKRRYNHYSNIDPEEVIEILEKLQIEQLNTTVNRHKALMDLLDRCPKCKENYEKGMKG
jgi:hypothetical protein